MDNTEHKPKDLRQTQGHVKGLAAPAQAEGISIEQLTHKQINIFQPLSGAEGTDQLCSDTWKGYLVKFLRILLTGCQIQPLLPIT